MKQIEKFKIRIRGLTNTISRYPLTVVFLLAFTIFNAITISHSDDYSKILLTLTVGVSLSVVFQATYERYFSNYGRRFLFMGGAVLLTGAYYLMLHPLEEIDTIMGIRTSVAVFALAMTYVLIPTIKSKISFNQSFLAAFKAFFVSLFFSTVIFIGVSIILFAIDRLIVSVNYRAYAHALNIIYAMFAPIYFLSFIPLYPKYKGGDQEQLEVDNAQNDQESLPLENEMEYEREELLQKATSYPRFLEVLISYIIIPITAVFTVILLLYLILNINGSFWTDNLLEPLLVSYSISVIIIYVLASRLNDKIAIYFRKIFPKVLVPIVLFQTIASIIKIGDIGITYGRYYAILFGIFATIAGVLMSLLPVRKNGIIAAVLIGFSIVSITPPVDAFTISKVNQISMLEKVLIKNNMLLDNQINPNDTINDQDKQIIINTVNYLRRMNYTKDIVWLDDYHQNGRFNEIFGFPEYVQVKNENGEYKYIYLYLERNSLIDIAGYDFFVNMAIPSGKGIEGEIKGIEIEGKTYRLISKEMNKENEIILEDSLGQELIRFSTKELFDRFENEDSSNRELTMEKATFMKENDVAKMSLVVQNVNIDIWPEDTNKHAELYVLVKIK